jgi:hypothetical protein
MKIDYAIMSSDDNPLYLDFWPIVAKAWKRLGIQPVLIYFGNKEVDRECGLVINQEPNMVNVPLATCWMRFWMAGQMEGVSIITDIDMIPLSKWYFVDQIEDYPKHSYLHINPCIETYSRYPSCYHIASGEKYKQVLEMNNDFNSSYIEMLSKNYDNSTCYIKGGNNKWCFDEYYCTEKMQKNMDLVTLIDRPEGQSGHRIDRTRWIYSEDKLSKGYYFDSHSLRPYDQHKKEIDRLIEIVFKDID